MFTVNQERLAGVRTERQQEKKAKEDRIQELHEKLDQWQEQQKEKQEQLKKVSKDKI